jgi:hypothetical protein
MVGAPMLERFHYFSMACAVVLASGCLGALIGSLQRSRWDSLQDRANQKYVGSCSVKQIL